MKDAGYTGRFAPSPTGPLHLGSLLAAAASYLEARVRNGRWLVRIDDVDVTRKVPRASTAILTVLEQFGFEWDGEVVRQSTRTAHYEDSLRELVAGGLAYPCACSRSDYEGLIYPGTCREGTSGRKPRSIRLRTDARCLAFEDRIQGHYQQQLEDEVGDFVVRRADGLFAYHLATVVDDALQDVTEIVRGSDLLDSTPRQIYLQRLLGYREPDYAHVPVLINDEGHKLSKRTAAQPVAAGHPAVVLSHILELLGQTPPADLAKSRVEDLWQWAVTNWSMATVPRQLCIRE